MPDVFCNCACFLISLNQNNIFSAMRFYCINGPCHDLAIRVNSNSQINLIAYVICLAVNHEGAFAHVLSSFCFFTDLLGIHIKNIACLQSELPSPAECACRICCFLFCFFSNGFALAFHYKKRRACHVGVEHQVIRLRVLFDYNLV